MNEKEKTEKENLFKLLDLRLKKIERLKEKNELLEAKVERLEKKQPK